MAYIEFELAKRSLHNSNSPPRQTSTFSPANLDNAPSDLNPSTQGSNDSKLLERQPAALGKLLEIDLGNEARDRNVARTEHARRRLDGEAVDSEEDVEGNGLGGKSKKVRLGRDGKPWRGRKRRTSEDIRRDQLVEEVLRENRRLCPL
jgi:Hepatocellular carcinoma-associated antigen 59